MEWRTGYNTHRKHDSQHPISARCWFFVGGWERYENRKMLNEFA